MTVNGRGRVTIRHIAERAGVSKGAVSYALNGRPGRLGRDARAHPRDRARARLVPEPRRPGALGRARPRLRARARAAGADAGARAVLHGVHRRRRVGARARSIALTIQLVGDVDEEIEVYRRWWGEQRVDGVLMVDLRLEDPRVAALAGLGLPAVVVGGPLEDGALPAVWHDERTTMVDTVRYLRRARARADRPRRGPRRVRAHGRAHRRVRRRGARARPRVGGGRDRLHAGERRARDAAAALGARAADRDRLRQRRARGHAASASSSRWASPCPRTSRSSAWDDSLICQVVHPPLTAVSRDIVEYGIAAGRHLLAAIDGDRRTTTSRHPRAS